MKRTNLRKLGRFEVTFTIKAEQEDLTEVRGNAMASGDDAFDKQVEDEILERLNRGDIWAWANVTVIAEWNGFRGVSNLGCCNYESEESFKSDPYYEQMRVEALDNLQASIEGIYEKISLLDKDKRVAKRNSRT